MRLCKSWIGQGESLDKAAYSHLLDCGLCSIKTATADADEVHCRQPKQDTGGSDALCLRTPPVLGSHSINFQQMTIQANLG